MKRIEFKMTMECLVSTGLESYLVLGELESLTQVREIIRFLDDFWNGDGQLSDVNWETKLDEMIKAAK